jgi:hypothetical protein
MHGYIIIDSAVLTALSISVNIIDMVRDEASQAAPLGGHPAVAVQKNVEIPMRDGTILRADVYGVSVEPRPAILLRTPYDKSTHAFTFVVGVDAIRAAEEGFVCVLQDTRGRYASDGKFVPFMHEKNDGYDTIQWIAEQAWCDGDVFMTGASYCGATQLLAAQAQPPALRAIFPKVTSSDYFENWTYQGGAFQLGFVLFWSLLSLVPDHVRRTLGPDNIEDVLRALDNVDELFLRTPLDNQSELHDFGVEFYFDWLKHHENDDFWTSLAPREHYDQIQVPAFHMGGWFDIFQLGTLENFSALSLLRDDQHLIVGPWTHNGWGDRLHETRFLHSASSDYIDLDGVQFDFFRSHRSGTPKSEPSSRVRIFVMGANVWREEKGWPLDRSVIHPLALRAHGELATDPGLESSIDYVYRPTSPAPTIGGATLLPGPDVSENAGPRRHPAPGARADVVSFVSPALTQAVEVTGEIRAEIQTTILAESADVVVRLLDVDEDDRATLIVEGIRRAAANTSGPQMVGVVLGATSIAFQPGHRVRVDVTSSSFPRFDRNPSELAEPTGALIREIHVGGAAGSTILLPVVGEGFPF